jgi:hypothetical protein
MEATQTYIRSSLSKKKPGDLVFPTDYRGYGTEAAIKKALSRLARGGAVRRLSHGIYYIPKTDPVLGELKPAAEEVAQMIARKEKIKIRPTGAYALNKLGLTTQVPTKLVYITDGNAKQFRVGKLPVKFIPTSHKKLSMVGEISGLVIQALEELDMKEITPAMAERIRELLLKENSKKLKHDLTLAPARVNDFIVKLLKSDIKK